MKQSAGSDGRDKPLLVIVMGVSGAGKTTLAEALAERCGYRFLDADDFHSPDSRAHMASGKPLTDRMREPWINAICDHLRELASQNVDATLAFSGLRKIHREPLRHTGYRSLFLFLDGDEATIAERMQARTEHFMPPSLLESQFASLERPEGEADVFPLKIDAPLSRLVQEAIDTVEAKR